MRVDPGDLDEEAERDDEQRGPQIRPPHHFADTAAAFVDRGRHIGQLGIDVGLRLDPPQRATRVGDPALEQIPAGGIGHAPQQRQQQRGRRGGQPEHRAPAVRSGQQVADQVTDDDAAKRRQLIRGHQRPTHRRRRRLGHIHRHHHHRQADCHTQQQTRHHQHRYGHRGRAEQGEHCVAGDDEHHRFLASDRVGEDAAAKRPGDLAEHRRGGQQLLFSSGEFEFLAERQQRTRDGGKVVPVEDADAGGGEPDEERPAPRSGQLTGTGALSTSTTRSGSSGAPAGVNPASWYRAVVISMRLPQRRHAVNRWSSPDFGADQGRLGCPPANDAEGIGVSS